MGHLVRQKSQRKLINQLDRYPLGAPGEKLIYDIISTIYTDAEAELASQLPLGLASLDKISKRTKIPKDVLKGKLDALADKGLVLDLQLRGRTKYGLPPTIVGLFEFSMMRVRDDFDQKKLSGLYRRYLVEEPEYFNQIKNNETTPFKTLIHEETIPPDYSEVLDYEKATEIVKNERLISVGLCHCRHVAHHREKDCRVFPMESCLSFGAVADYLIRHKFSREISQSETLEMLSRSREKGMVHIGDNVQRHPNFICQCCGCCCEVLESFRNFDFFQNTFSSNFEATIEKSRCDGCKKCQKACLVEAIDMIETGEVTESGKKKKIAVVDKNTCIGCGLCALKCKTEACRMVARPKRAIVPQNTTARTLMMAIENGKLTDLLVDRHASMSAAAMGVLIDAIVNLPPAKRLLAKESFKSRFVDFLISKGSV